MYIQLDISEICVITYQKPLSLLKLNSRHIFWPTISPSSYVLYINVTTLANWAEKLKQNIPARTD